jgi:T5SS/PEP-CTERM-associated repeat protein
VVNAGIITSNGAYSVTLDSAVGNRVIVLPGAQFGGKVDGGTPPGTYPSATLELASGASQGTLAGIGTQFVNFAQVTIDSGATWRLAGNNSLVAGVTLTDRGALLLNGLTLASAGPVTISGAAGNVAGISVSDAVWNGSGALVVGDAGAGSLAVNSGGSVLGLANAVVGAQAGSDGSDIDVVGSGSALQTNGELDVGKAAFGSVAIIAGGSVSAGQTDIGVQSGAAGIVSVVGNGSTFAAGSSLVVGDVASAELSILGGAQVSATNVDIGRGATGTGNVDIEGTGLELNVSGVVNIGEAGIGVLTLGNNTTLHAGGAVNIGANGRLNQVGGTVDPSVVNNTGRVGGKGSILASVSIANSGTLLAASGTETLTAPIIAGTGTLEIDSKGDLTVNVGSVVATQTVTFADGTGVLTIGTLGGFSATIGTIKAGDSIIVQGTSIASLSFNPSTQVLSLFDPSQAQAGVLQFGPSVVDQTLISVNGLTPCFVAGTRIGTERGEVPVEELRVGDRVQVLLGGGAEPVVWLGRRTVNCARYPEPRKVWPVQVRAHAFGPGRPSRDLWLSPDHSLYIGGALIPVKYLINGTTIAQSPCDEVTYYHVELPQHSVLLAEGLPAESYLDTGDRANFLNNGGAIALHPDFAVRQWEAAGCAALVVTGPRLEAVRQWIDAMAWIAAKGTIATFAA